jgi:hypothetical protein
MGTIYRRAAERVFLDLLDKVMAEGRHVSDSKHASNSIARRKSASLPGRPRNSLGAKETLFDNGEIKMQPYDRKGGKHRCIIRCADPEEAIFDGACASPKSERRSARTQELFSQAAHRINGPTAGIGAKPSFGPAAA